MWGLFQLFQSHAYLGNAAKRTVPHILAETDGIGPGRIYLQVRNHQVAVINSFAGPLA